MLTQSTLKALLHYDPDTGVFTWLQNVNSRARAGERAGTVSAGRTAISVCGERHFAHRLAWLYIHGTWPAAEIDHVNRDQNDNRLCNLREATRSQNQFNCRAPTVTPPGVTWFKQTNRWRARIKVQGREHLLGYFPNMVDAVAARLAAEKEFYKGFARHAGR